MVHFGLKHCMLNITETINDNIANFPDGLYTQTRMQLLAWVLQVPATNRNDGCWSTNQDDERHPHIQERLDHPGHILQPVEYMTPSLPLPYKKNEDLFRTREKPWHPTPITTTYQHLFTWQKLFVTKDPRTQDGRKEEESQSTSEKKVQGEMDHTAHACQPIFAHKPDLVHWSYSNSGYNYGNNPDASGKISSHDCHINTCNCI